MPDSDPIRRPLGQGFRPDPAPPDFGLPPGTLSEEQRLNILAASAVYGVAAVPRHVAIGLLMHRFVRSTGSWDIQYTWEGQAREMGKEEVIERSMRAGLPVSGPIRPFYGVAEVDEHGTLPLYCPWPNGQLVDVRERVHHELWVHEEGADPRCVLVSGSWIHMGYYLYRLLGEPETVLPELPYVRWMPMNYSRDSLARLALLHDIRRRWSPAQQQVVLSSLATPWRLLDLDDLDVLRAIIRVGGYA